MTTPDENWHKVLVLAPVGRDGPASAELLRRVGLTAALCANFGELIKGIEAGAAAALVAEEGLIGNDIATLSLWVERQRPWSDLPFVILTSHQVQTSVRAWRQQIVATLQNVSLLERPVQGITLSSTVQAAVRARLRQYEVRALLEAQARTADMLETQVAERTEALEAANSLLRQQMTERAQVEEALRQSQKMEAVGQLTGGLAHDFNNLLAGISGSLELIHTRMQQGRFNDVERYVAAAQGASKRAAALTHRLLAFSRRQTLAPKAINVNTMLSGILEMIQRTVGPSVQVDTVAMAGLWPVLVDQSQLENALLNLCINSRDAMPEGGRITIETANRWIDRHGAKQHDMPEGQYLSLCVSDTGTGMPPDVIAKAFDPFFTTKPLGEGTGLGLSMIYGFAKQSGGQVRIYSEMGKGTMVCIYLPRHRGESEHEEIIPEGDIQRLAEPGETVLVVDDEATVRMLVTDVLSDLGYTAIEAVDGAGGLRVLQSDIRIDLLVTDVGLPGGLNGRQMADAARIHRPDLKVMFITGFAENALLNSGQLEPRMSVLTKPFALETLAARIRELIAS